MKKSKKETTFSISDELKEIPTKLNLSKFEYDLFHDEDDVVMPVSRVKYTKSSGGEKWKFYHDSKLIFTLEGVKLNKKEKEFLYSENGFNFLLNSFKSGIVSLPDLKAEIKKKLTANG